MTSSQPKVTVLMPVYNGEQHLGEAIDSILCQTFTDFEFLIINDGSNDQSVAVIESYRDPRIRLVHNETNCGLIHTLNRGLDLARGELIARMDCDDISMPERLARQAAFMDIHPAKGICGTWFSKFGSGREKVVRWQTDPDGIRCGLLFDAMVGHPTVMLRREIVRKYGLRYDPSYRDAEDYELWVRATEHCELANLDEVLLRYRVHPTQVTQSHAAGQRKTAGKVRMAQLHRMGINPSSSEFEIHQVISTCQFPGIQNLFAKAEEWLCRLKIVNDHAGIYPEPAFSHVLIERWLVFCKKAVEQGLVSPKAVYFPKLLKTTGLGSGYVVRYYWQQIKNG